MEVLVLYETVFGNTRRIAQAIGAALSDTYHVEVLPIAEITAFPPNIDLLVVGGPTHRRKVSPTMRAFLGRVPRGALRGVAAASFDTRYPGARWLTGSAAVGIARALKQTGVRLVAAPESFSMERDVPPRGEKRRHALEQLEPGEEERAGTWARRCSEALAPWREHRLP
jgi:flavorubredoxin